MANINETIANVEKLDPELARQIRKYVRDHNYGLVFEHNLPEAVELYTKTAAVGDTVNIRPERGKNETDENKVAWNVKAVKDGMATIENGEDEREVAVSDLVPIVSYRDVIYPGLREVDRVERGDKNDPYQVVINAENYHALEMLTYCYAGKVDCIYIDPPYNNGAKDWKYNNDYVDGNDQYRHSKWLVFMERRLKLAKRLLNPKDSALIVTIDEKERDRLGLLLEQLFPEATIQMVTSVVSRNGTSRENEFSRVEEYIYVCRFGNMTVVRSNDNMLSEGDKGVISRVWFNFMRTSTLRKKSSRQFFPIFIDPSMKKIIKIGKALALDEDTSNIAVPDGCIAVFPIKDNGQEATWGAIQQTTKKLLEDGFLRVGSINKKTGFWSIQYVREGDRKRIDNKEIIIKGYEKDGSAILEHVDVNKREVFPKTVWNRKPHDATEYGSRLLKPIIGDDRFSYPKSLYAVRDTLHFFVADKPDALIVDFFAGSGTTIHAVNLLNAEDGGHRRCICVTNNEVSADEQKTFIENGLRPGDDEWEAHGIARYVTWPRTKCAIEGVNVNGDPLKGNYDCPVESYDELDVDVVDRKTGKKINDYDLIDTQSDKKIKKIYKKEKHPSYPELADLKMSNGFKANAIFFDLTYESAWPIRLDNAFDAIAPILWMQAGARGPIIHRVGKSYLITDYYGVLFDYGQASKFVEAMKKHPNIKSAFVVTDDQRRYSNMCRRLPGIEVHRLYETFLRTFEICGEGGLD